MNTNKQITYFNLSCVDVDYKNPLHTEALLSLLQIYATDPMGGGAAIALKTLKTLIDEMQKRSFVFSLLIFGQAQDALTEPDAVAVPVAFANCIESFSTFKGRAVVNIHDFAVIPEARGQGVSQRLIAGIEEAAKARGACKLTLEVLEGNKIAQNAYVKAGFKGYELDPEMGRAMFWEKSL